MVVEKVKLAVTGAMDVEVRLLIDALREYRQENQGAFVCHCGKLNGVSVVVVQCGIGKVAMACVTQMLIDCYHPEGIINCGVAGGLAQDLMVGDVVVSEQLVEHDIDLSPLGYVRGVIPGLSKHDTPTYFQADSDMVQRLLTAARQRVLGHNVRAGIVASGEQFVASSETKRLLVDMFHADVVEMEGAGLAHVATLQKVPFAVLRVVSDAADGKAPAVYATFEAEVARMASEIVLEYCRNLA